MAQQKVIPSVRTLGLCSAIAAILLVAAGCGHPVTTLDAAPHSSVASLATASTTPASTATSLVAPGQLTVCTTDDYAPFEFREHQQGPVVGFDMDLVAQVASDLDVALTPVAAQFGDIVSGAIFDDSRCDLAASAVTITTERAQSVVFTDPYFQATQGLLVRTGAPYVSEDDLHEVTVGVEKNTTSEQFAADNLVADVTTFATLTAAEAALRSGTVDAVIADTPAAAAYAAKNPAVTVNAEFSTGEQYGLIIAGNNPGLLKAANATLTRVSLDGTLHELEEKWFGP